MTKIGFRNKTIRDQERAESLPVLHTVHEGNHDITDIADMLIQERIHKKAVDLVCHFMQSPFSLPTTDIIRQLDDLRRLYKSCY